MKISAPLLYVTYEGLQALLNAPKRVQQESVSILTREMHRAMALIRSHTKKKYLSGPYGGEHTLQPRTGRLRNSWGSPGPDGIFQISARGSRVVGQVGSKSVYAKILEEGGTITPKRRSFLTIPLDAAKTPAGVTRKAAPYWEDAFFIKSKRGSLLLVHRRGGEIEPLFLLVKRVDIRGRHYAEQTLEDLEDEIQGIFERAGTDIASLVGEVR